MIRYSCDRHVIRGSQPPSPGTAWASSSSSLRANFAVRSLARRCDRVVVQRSRPAAKDGARDGDGIGNGREEAEGDGGEGCRMPFITQVGEFWP